MSKYKVNMLYADGTENEEDYIFDTEEEAIEHGEYMLSCLHLGEETMFMSNPGDYPLDDSDEGTFEVFEVDE